MLDEQESGAPVHKLSVKKIVTGQTTSAVERRADRLDVAHNTARDTVIVSRRCVF